MRRKKEHLTDSRLQQLVFYDLQNQDSLFAQKLINWELSTGLSVFQVQATTKSGESGESTIYVPISVRSLL